jgi:chromosome segregation ATPase
MNEDKLDSLFNRYDELLFKLVQLEKARGLPTNEKEEESFLKIHKRLDELEDSIKEIEIAAPETASKLKGSLNDLSDYYKWEHVLFEQQRSIDSVIHRSTLREERTKFRLHEMRECVKEFHRRLMQMEDNLQDLRGTIEDRIKGALRS